jgi:hypothetical protein
MLHQLEYINQIHLLTLVNMLSRTVIKDQTETNPQKKINIIMKEVQIQMAIVE